MRGEAGAGIAHIHLGDRMTTMRMSKPRVRQHTKSHTLTLTHTHMLHTETAVQHNPENPPPLLSNPCGDKLVAVQIDFYLIPK